MSKELITARYTVKDAEGNVEKDAEGKAVYAECQAEFDFGDNLSDLTAKCGEDVVRTNAIANMKVSLQSRIRALHKAGLDQSTLQGQIDQWVPGVIAQKVAVDPIAATMSQFANWPKEKQQEFLAKLQGGSAE